MIGNKRAVARPSKRERELERERYFVESRIERVKVCG